MNMLKKSNLLKRLRSNKKGFTLIELIVVVVIILILAAVLVPNVLRYVGQAQRATVKQDAATILTQVQADLAVISSLDAQGLLKRMERMEQDGTAFRNRQVQDVRVQYRAPVIVTVIMVALMAALCGLILWGYMQDPENAPPLLLLICFMGMLAAVGIGAVLALTQRIREIQKGEMDDARHY